MEKGWHSVVLEPNREDADYLRRFDLEVIETMFERMDIGQLDE